MFSDLVNEAGRTQPKSESWIRWNPFVNALQIAILSGHTWHTLNPWLHPTRTNGVWLQPTPQFRMAVRKTEHATVVVARRRKIDPHPITASGQSEAGVVDAVL